MPADLEEGVEGTHLLYSKVCISVVCFHDRRAGSTHPLKPMFGESATELQPRAPSFPTHSKRHSPIGIRK